MIQTKTIKTIAIIPARGQSKRLPKKNSKLLNGLPLLVYSIQYAQKQAEIDAVYVSTDDAEIKAIALQYGAEVIERPEALSGDLEPTISALQHAVKTINCSTLETVVLLQPTNPLRPKELFANAFQYYTNNKCDSVFTVSRNHHKLGSIQSDKFIPHNYTPGQRSQDLEPLYFENGLLYITRVAELLKGFIITEDGYPYLVEHPFASIDIDTQDDFDLATFKLNFYIND
ncbi:acylneuraminate cytidylyltransferase family protein [Bizionia gelidisalsuginis]|uniref:acylneuraminate cytidylyltransferase family protein n=1 Tax=Bizionia gelidisalsuginis TaxID=291188 RepID=UPI001FE9C949|nr:acylneuraminate cytidylyltransferase family protein [Bizionia gelidisalsuginis]